MVGVKKSKTCFLITAVFLFQYLLLQMYCEGNAYTDLLNVQFLNFDKMQEYQLSRFAIEFLVPFILLFLVLYNSQISFLSVTVSYLTMYMNKRSRNETLKEIIVHTGSDQLIFLFMFVLLSTGITVFDQLLHEENYADLFCFFIYITRYMLLVNVMISCLRIYALKEEVHAEAMIPYGIFIGFTIIDYIFGIHLITYSNVLSVEIMYLIVLVVSGSLVEGLLIHKFMKGDFI